MEAPLFLIDGKFKGRYVGVTLAETELLKRIWTILMDDRTCFLRIVVSVLMEDGSQTLARVTVM
jgi:hypothetical protein